ncbi:unnamed protein product [Phytophthora fragariaefolia]|uniref:Unnamed protein product n=1 Tax=Phytophthora fragariaefolia TaxID=1490495 RepID=A0A9W6XR28_9STRA|nr:unnamed protein product [Phytophthora fragariaefolia]
MCKYLVWVILLGSTSCVLRPVRVRSTLVPAGATSDGVTVSSGASTAKAADVACHWLMWTNTRAGSVLISGGLSSTLSGAGNERIEWHYVRGECCVWCGVAGHWGRRGPRMRHCWCVLYQEPVQLQWSAVLVVALALVCIAVVVVRSGSGGDWSVTQGNSTDVASDVELLIGVWISRRSR